MLLVKITGEPHFYWFTRFWFLREVANIKHVLSIAGSDSCAGAGLQADLKTIAALRAYGLSVVTAVTAQNTRGVRAIQEISPGVVRAQLEAIFTDIRVDAVKIGMLFSSELIEAVAGFFAELMLRHIPGQRYGYEDLPIVLDPVMVAKSGDKLLQPEAVLSLQKRLFPLVKIITPNLPEAEVLLRRNIGSLAEMEAASRELLKFGPAWVILKGGHLSGEPVDMVAHGQDVHYLEGAKITTTNNHGTGCTFSSALATFLSQGHDELTAARKAKQYVASAMAGGFAVGQGVGILQHFPDNQEI